MGKGRKLTVKIKSAEGLLNTDTDGSARDVSDPFVVCCFDGNVRHELGRTEVAENTLNPEWNEKFTFDISTQINNHINQELPEPKYLTFYIYDGDVDKCEPLGNVGIYFKELLEKGSVDETYPIKDGTGTLKIACSLKKVKQPMTGTQKAAVGAGVAVGATALGLFGAYMLNRRKKKKEEAAEGEEAGDREVEEEYEEDDDEGEKKPWWEFDDDSDDDDDE